MRDRRILQLNVTLLKPMKSVYDVTISSALSSETNHCVNVNHCVQHGIPKVCSSIIEEEIYSEDEFIYLCRLCRIKRQLHFR